MSTIFSTFVTAIHAEPDILSFYEGTPSGSVETDVRAPIVRSKYFVVRVRERLAVAPQSRRDGIAMALRSSGIIPLTSVSAHEAIRTSLNGKIRPRTPNPFIFAEHSSIFSQKAS